MQVYMGGIVPTSFQNWKKSSCLAIFFAGCDFKCTYCNTPEFLEFKEEYLVDILDVKRQINAFANTVESVVFTGGEPFLQRQALLNLARHSKQIGLLIGMQTNGSNPNTLLSLIRENIIDIVEMDIKAPLEEIDFEKNTRSKTFFKQTNEIIKDIKKTLSLLKKNQKKIEIYFKTIINPEMNEETIKKIGEMIKDIDSTWILQKFHPEYTKESHAKSTDDAELIVLKEKLQKQFPKQKIEIGTEQLIFLQTE